MTTLFLPLRERASVWAATLCLFAYYALSAARDLSLYDSGELALAAVQLGLGHPPGQPLHTLLGFTLSHLPFVTPLYGVTLASLVPAALTLVAATSVAQSLLGERAPRELLRLLPWLLALAALHPVLWEPSTRVEVYALATFFAVWAVARLTFPAGDAQAPATLAPKHVLAAGLALGACASVNPMIALCAGLAVTPALLAQLASKRLAARAIPLAILGGVLGLLPYAYVFAIASRTDVMVWGAPTDAKSLWHYFTLQDYNPNHALTLGLWASHFVSWLPWATTHWLLPALAIGCAACFELGARTTLGRSAAPLLLALLVAQISFNVVWNLDVPDYAGYVASGLWLMLAGAAAYIAEAYTRRRLLAALVISACVLLSSLVASPNAFARTRQRDHLARALAEQALREAPRDAIVITEVDYIAGALFYLQEVEHARPDVIVLAYGLGSSRWHWQRIYQQHRGLAPISLVGPGGKPGRVQRFLAAHASRAVLLERASLAPELQLTACAGGLYFRTGAACATPATNLGALHTLLTRTQADLDDGSPGSEDAIAQVAFYVGEALWRLGDARAAYTTLLAGVPLRHQPIAMRSAPPSLAQAPALQARLPAFRRQAALGDPARNLFVAALLLDAAGEPNRARALMHEAAQLGLPEAFIAQGSQ